MLEHTDPLTRFAAMISKARANALPKIARFTLSDLCMGHVVDDANAGVSGAAGVLESCPNADLRARAAQTLIEIAAAYREARAGVAASIAPTPTQPGTTTAAPEIYTGNRSKALNAIRGLPGYQLPKPSEPIEGGLF